MRVALDAMYVGGGVAGGRVYFEGLLRGLATIDDGTEFTIFVRREAAVPTLPDRFKVVRAPVSQTSIVKRTLWEYFALPRRLKGQGFDLFHALGSVSPSPPPPAKFILTIHDLIHRIFPHSVPLGHRLFTRYMQAKIVPRADRIIVPSQTSRDDVLRFCSTKPERIRTLTWGAGNGFQPIEDANRIEAVLHKFGLAQPYIISVGRGYPHKNVIGLLKAFALLTAPQVAEVKLALVGERYLVGSELDAAIDELGIRARISFLGFATNEELNALYCGASLFAFPSLAEGLGLPIVEAMQCGVPVVASNASAVPETVGDAGVLVDATDPEAFAAALTSVLLDEKKRLELRELGLKRAIAFSWEKAAAETLAVYREVL